MRILFAGRYNRSENLSGPEKVAKRIFGECTLSDSTVFAEYFFDGRKYSYFKKLFGKELVTEINGSAVYKFGLIRLFFILFKYKPSVIHIITYERFALIFYIYGIFRNVKIIYNVHGIILYENTFLRDTGKLYFYKDKFCENIFIRYSGKLIFLSERSVSNAEKFYKLDNDRISIIPNGVDKVFSELSKQKTINRSGPLKIVFAGDHSRKEKGLEFLKDALKETEFEAELYLLGNFTDMETERIKNINLYFSEKMETEKFALFLRDKDIFVSSSYYEQFSITTAEAMSSGLVPVVTIETGISSLIKDGYNGFIFSYGDIDCFTGIIRSLNSDRDLLQKISLKSAGIYFDLSWTKIYVKYKQEYE